MDSDSVCTNGVTTRYWVYTRERPDTQAKSPRARGARIARAKGVGEVAGEVVGEAGGMSYHEVHEVDTKDTKTTRIALPWMITTSTDAIDNGLTEPNG